ncbi:3-oxoacyl-ACP synthase III family protein [Eisenibacter elegans]|uniref:3-oxoacyl-ACP synthase III family protein n=1 Tax=Eisenibacter elegans TaxID=997 RepID=UPI000414E8BB|nr:ketoacyl-ACP synthase III [Eisenibacter elegans]
MYLVRVSGYIPDAVVPNAHFSQLNGMTEEWILERTGIEERRKAQAHENTNSMAVEAVRKGLVDLPFDPAEIGLIVGGTYTPYDTIHTLAHAAQHFLNISDIPVLSVSSACSSFANTLEVVQGYFAMGKAEKALVVLSDNNTRYSDERDKIGGHLWGDGATALFVSKTRVTPNDLEIIDILTGGAGNVGKAPEGVFLRPAHEGFVMQYGKDVFLNACQYMAKVTQDILARNGYTTKQLSYFVPHQANLRITKNVARTLELPDEKALSNIQYLGNTGCAGCAIALYEHWERFQTNDLIAVTVFGGGYSYGSVLMRKV